MPRVHVSAVNLHRIHRDKSATLDVAVIDNPVGRTGRLSLPRGPEMSTEARAEPAWHVDRSRATLRENPSVLSECQRAIPTCEERDRPAKIALAGSRAQYHALDTILALRDSAGCR